MYLFYQRNKEHQPNTIHKIVESLLDKNSTPKEGRTLWLKQDSQLTILSPYKPNKPNIKFNKIDVNSFQNDIYEFTIRLNPCIQPCKRNNGRKRIINKDNMKEWIENKLKKDAGFKNVEFVHKFTLTEIDRPRQHKSFHSASVFVTGIGSIKDYEIFHNSIKNGIGFNKAFGFGLLNIFKKELL